LIHSLRQAAYKHGYLIITAAWLYTLSFIFINYWSYHSSPQKVQNKLEQHLLEQEKRFAKVIFDTVLLNSLDNQNLDVTDPLKDDIGLFIFRQNVSDTPVVLSYWNTNRMYINSEERMRDPGSYFVNNQNGK
jgi:two-component system nitrogen regulation sensor histidine kinase NtrY